MRWLTPAVACTCNLNSPDGLVPAKAVCLTKPYADRIVTLHSNEGVRAYRDRMVPEALVELFNSIYSELDDLTEKYDLEKIKTIGDAYMVIAGAPKQRTDHAEAMAAMSLEIRERCAKVNKA